MGRSDPYSPEGERGEDEHGYGLHREDPELEQVERGDGYETTMTPIKSDGLRFHAAAPIISALRNKG